MKKTCMFFVLLSLLSCVQEKEAPVTVNDGEKVKVSFSLAMPESSVGEETKVAFGNDGKFEWTGNESAKLIFGIDGKNNSDNPVIPSVAPGVFEGEILVPTGYTMDNLRGIVVPADNGANFRGDHSSDKARIRMYVDYEQIQDVNGKHNPKFVPLFAELTSADLKQVNGVYTIPGVQLKSGSAMVAFNIYGKHPDSESGEIFKSIRIDANDRLANRAEYNLGRGATGYNSNGNPYAQVSLTEVLTIADKTADNGIKAYLSVVLSGDRTVSKVTVNTDKAVYTKDISYKLNADKIDKLYIYQVGIDLSKDYTRSSYITYSIDGGESWSQTLPETFSKLAVQSASGVNISAETLGNIKAAIARQGAPVDLDMRKSTYESAVFPAIFGGTEDAKSNLLKSIRFPHNVTEIAENAFAYCSSLESVDLTGISTINTKAFFFSGLKTLDVPKNVTNIAGYLAFGCCANLNEIYYDSPSTHGDKASGYNHATFAFADVTAGTANTDNYAMDATKYPEFYPAEPQCIVTIGPNVAYVARRMFIHNANIGKIIFQGKPAKIGNYAFNFIKNIHTFDCRMMPSPISSYASDSYQKELGQSARTAGKELKILVSTGMSDSFKAQYPFKWMVKNGWTIVEEEAVPAALDGVRIGTYNVRIQSSGDGNNNWPTRKPITIQSIKDIDFDIFGLQEAQTYHHTDLKTALGDIYTFDWFCPNKGSSKESIGIAYKTSDWSLATRNTFWINPDDPSVQKAYDYSSGYNSYFYRGAIAGIFIHKKTGTKVFFMCTHGCLGQTQNEDSAFLYPQQEALYNPDALPSFFVGDFNARPEWASSVLYREYWNDTYMSIDESLRQGCDYTFNGWDSPEGRTGARIDFIYYKGTGVTPTLYKCDNTLYDGKYPSDHWPVFADFTIAPPTE